jgi:hypothetical protein
MRIFSKIYDISISAVELRHYYSTYINYLVKHKELTEKEHRKICDMMNHSYEENKKICLLFINVFKEFLLISLNPFILMI